MALPGHRGHVLHRPDRLVHRPPRRQPADGLQQPLSARHRPHPPRATPRASCSTTSAATTSEVVDDPPAARPASTEHAGRATGSHARPARPDQPASPEKAEALDERSSRPPAPRPRSSRSKTYNWPLPYDELTNPLSIDLTAAQHLHPDLLVGHDGPGPRGHPATATRRKCTLFLLATVADRLDAS